jgi:Tol biopolymer transport system component
MVRITSRHRYAAVALWVCVFLAFAPARAGAAYPGHSGVIAWAYDAIDSGTAQPDYGVVTVAGRPGNCEIQAAPAVCSDRTVVSCNSGGAAPCPKYSHLSYSPDGKRLVWAMSLNGTSEIVLAKANGSHRTTIPRAAESDLEPSFSPGGTRLLYVRVRGALGHHQIVTSDLSGAHKRLITTITGDDPAWSPDGRHILFVHSGAIWVVGADGHCARRLIRNAKLPDWSPDGRRIAYIGRSDLRAHTANANGSGQRMLRVSSADVTLQPTGSSQPYVDFVVWSPDGKRIALAGTDDAGGPEIVVVPSGGGRARVVDSFDTNIAGTGTVGLTWQPLR